MFGIVETDACDQRAISASAINSIAGGGDLSSASERAVARRGHPGLDDWSPTPEIVACSRIT
jgi:hypothetical protein